MQAGMMWFDSDEKKSLTEKINRAATYYRKKYGCSPDICFVNPAMIPEKMPEGKISIRPYQALLANHIWIGVDDSPRKKVS